MSWQVRTADYGSGKYTAHRSEKQGSRWAGLNVSHTDGGITVDLFGSGAVPAGTLGYSKGDRAVITTKSPGSSFSHENVAAPSETLQQLIRQHHLHPDQWPILLDAIQEEYPQLHEAIEAHHAARRSATAEHYARAVSAALSATR